MSVTPSPTGAAATTQTSVDQVDARAASSWIRGNLATSVTVAADPDTAALLRNDGMDHVTSLPAPADQLRFVRYLVTSSDAKASATAPASLRKQAATVATFGQPGHLVRVQQVVPLAADETVRDVLARDRRARKLAGAQLATNPSVHTTKATAAALAGGQLDLRAATVLASLSENGPVRLDRIDQVAAERRADMPIRMITITVSDAGATGSQIRALAAPYGADSSQLSPRQVSVEWPVDVAAALPVQ